MLSGVVTNRYTAGLYSFAEAHGATAPVDESLQTLTAVLAEHSDFEALLNHPLIKGEDKLNAVKAVFGDALDPLVTRFLHVLFKRNRGAYIRAIADRFHELTEAARGEVLVEVETAKPLGEAEVTALAAKLGQAVNRQVSAKVKVNQDLIGGYRLRVGNRVLDATVQGALGQFAEQLKATGVGLNH
jgi:F-type H+-transporting ATPase subunit delta